MVQKKTKKSKRVPEQTQSEKLQYEKAENRSLRKRITNLENRMLQIEKIIEKFDKKPVKKIKKKEVKSDKELFREEFLKKHRPKGKK